MAVPRAASRERITVAMIQQAIAEKPVTMSKMRQVIAQRLTASFTTTPHFYVTVAVDMTDLLEWRKHLKTANKPFTVTDFILKAVALALVEFPALNSSTDGRATRWHQPACTLAWRYQLPGAWWFRSSVMPTIFRSPNCTSAPLAWPSRRVMAS